MCHFRLLGGHFFCMGTCTQPAQHSSHAEFTSKVRSESQVMPLVHSILLLQRGNLNQLRKSTCQIPLHGPSIPYPARIFAIHMTVLRLLGIWAKIANCLPVSMVPLPHCKYRIPLFPPSFCECVLPPLPRPRPSPTSLASPAP